MCVCVCVRTPCLPVRLWETKGLLCLILQHRSHTTDGWESSAVMSDPKESQLSPPPPRTPTPPHPPIGGHRTVLTHGDRKTIARWVGVGVGVGVCSDACMCVCVYDGGGGGHDPTVMCDRNAVIPQRIRFECESSAAHMSRACVRACMYVQRRQRVAAASGR